MIGFWVGSSCLSNLLTFLEKATKVLDDSLCLDVIYLDLAKAFDKVLISDCLISSLVMVSREKY